MNTPDTEMMKLAERCEAATGANRVLDAEIYVALDPALGNVDALTTSGAVGSWVPHFTASIDDAVTLVPKSCEWGAGSWGNPDTYGPWAWCATRQQSSENDLDYGKAATPALALCAAALKSRISGDGL